MAQEPNLVRIRMAPPAPGEMTTAEVDGTVVAIANVGGKLRAFDDACTHRGCSLADGTLAGPTVICGCHKSRFDLRFGDVLDGPADEPIRIRSVAQEGDELLIEA